MQIHRRVAEINTVVLVAQADIIQLHVPDRYQAPERLFLFLPALEGIHEELVVPRTIRQAVYIRHHIAEPYMAEPHLSVPERERTEMRVELPDERQGVAPLILQIDILHRHPRRKPVLHRTYGSVRT